MVLVPKVPVPVPVYGVGMGEALDGLFFERKREERERGGGEVGWERGSGGAPTFDSSLDTGALMEEGKMFQSSPLMLLPRSLVFCPSSARDLLQHIRIKPFSPRYY